jgi:hypothetical protein
MRPVLALCLINILTSAPLVQAGISPVLYFSSENIAGDTVKDDSGNGNDGTLIGTKQVDGKEGKGLELEAGDRVEMESSDSLHPDLFQGNFTLAMWINPTRTGDDWQQLWRSRQTDNHTTLFLNNNGTLSWRGDVGEAWTILCEAPDADPPAEEWTHVAVTGDMSKFRLYVNAELIQDGDWMEMDAENEMYYLGWGTASAGERYAGKYDEVVVFRETLSRDDLRVIMTQGVQRFVAVISSGKLTTTWGMLKVYE